MPNARSRVVAYTRNGRRQEDQIPPRPELPPSLVAAAEILGQDPKKRRKLGDIGRAIEQAWQDKAQRVHQYHLVKGDGQLASRNSTLPVRPTIRVTDAFGRPVRNQSVQFTAVGGGRIGDQTVKTATTDENGEVTGGLWQLGQGPGSNTIEVRVQNRLVASFHAVAYKEPETNAETTPTLRRTCS
jgi:hypothetical protein